MLGWATIATCAVPPAEFAMVSTLSRRALSRLSPVRLRLFLWSVAVVMTNRASAYSMLSAKSGMTSPTMASRSAAARPVMLGLVSHSTIWNPGGLVGMPPEAKLPSSHPPLTSRHRPGYLTATTAWYVTGLTLEEEGNINPQAWILLMPDVSELRVACRSPAIGCRVAACCKMYASLTRERRKSMEFPSSSSGSTTDGRLALSWVVASLKIPVAPGRSCWQSVRSCLYFAGKSSVHICPSECSPLSRVLAKAASWSLDELLRMAVIAFARVAGVQYFHALLSPCFLARSS